MSKFTLMGGPPIEYRECGYGTSHPDECYSFGYHDARELLKKYMQLVLDEESITFLNRIPSYVSEVEFDQDEIEELRKIESEINES